MQDRELAERYLSKAKRLSDVCEMQEIVPLSSAHFPGAHCPLFGALLAVGEMADAAALVVGTEECTYYAKSMALGTGRLGRGGERCFSLLLTEAEISFGCHEELSAAIREIYADTGCRLLFVITTCLVELIGDDLDSVCEALEDELQIHLPVIHTEHFKSSNHLPGLERVLLGCAELMQEPLAVDPLAFNLIGHRHGEFTGTELDRYLARLGYKVHLVLPSDARLEEIEQAAAVGLNLVTDPVGLPLAKKLKRKFQIPYVYFDRFVAPATIREAYETLGRIRYPDELPGELMAWLDQREEELAKLEVEASAAISGQSYFYGNSPLPALSLNSYLCQLGLEPKLIQLSKLGPDDAENREKILSYTDPYVTKNANIAPLQPIYTLLKPEFYFGHEFSERLRKKGIWVQALDRLGRFYGYELTEQLLKLLIQVAGEREQMMAKLEALS